MKKIYKINNYKHNKSISSINGFLINKTLKVINSATNFYKLISIKNKDIGIYLYEISGDYYKPEKLFFSEKDKEIIILSLFK